MLPLEGVRLRGNAIPLSRKQESHHGILRKCRTAYSECLCLQGLSWWAAPLWLALLEHLVVPCTVLDTPHTHTQSVGGAASRPIAQMSKLTAWSDSPKTFRLVSDGAGASASGPHTSILTGNPVCSTPVSCVYGMHLCVCTYLHRVCVRVL